MQVKANGGENPITYSIDIDDISPPEVMDYFSINSASGVLSCQQIPSTVGAPETTIIPVRARDRTGQTDGSVVVITLKPSNELGKPVFLSGDFGENVNHTVCSQSGVKSFALCVKKCGSFRPTLHKRPSDESRCYRYKVQKTH